MKTLMILISFASIPAFADTTVKAECNVSTQANMRTLNLEATRTESEVSVTITFTDFDSIIQNKTLKGTAKVSDLANGRYPVAMDLDPYAGKVGTFYWSFNIPEHFFSAGLPTEFQKENTTTHMGWKWEGTPSGAGNNSGIGWKDNWYCRSI